MNNWSAVEAAISAATQQTFRIASHHATGGVSYVRQAEQMMKRLLSAVR